VCVPEWRLIAEQIYEANDVKIRTIKWLYLLILVAGLASGCTEPIYHGLDEKEANEMVVVLEQHGLEAGKEIDPAGENTWMVKVPSAARVRAWKVLQVEGLPRPEVSGFSAFYPSGGLVPTASEERVLLQYSTAQELRKTLLAVDAVVAARVNLVLPEKPRVRLQTTVIEPPRASVLIKYHPSQKAPPLSEDEVKRLIAGGVEGLSTENVEVIFTRSTRSARPLVDPMLSSVGPVSVAHESKSIFQLLIFGMGLCILLLCAGLTFMVFRNRRMAQAAAVNDQLGRP
jgi:type III secretion protein J